MLLLIVKKKIRWNLHQFWFEHKLFKSCLNYSQIWTHKNRFHRNRLVCFPKSYVLDLHARARSLTLTRSLLRKICESGKHKPLSNSNSVFQSAFKYDDLNKNLNATLFHKILIHAHFLPRHHFSIGYPKGNRIIPISHQFDSSFIHDNHFSPSLPYLYHNPCEI